MADYDNVPLEISGLLPPHPFPLPLVSLSFVDVVKVLGAAAHDFRKQVENIGFANLLAAGVAVSRSATSTVRNNTITFIYDL